MLKFAVAEVPVILGGSSGQGRKFRSWGAELPVPGGTSGPSGRNFRSQSDLRAVLRFGRKSGPKIFEFAENLALEAVGRWGIADQHQRQVSIGPKPPKTQQIARSNQGQFGAIFWEKFLEIFFWAKLVELVGVGVKSVATKELLIPYDMG